MKRLILASAVCALSACGGGGGGGSNPPPGDTQAPDTSITSGPAALVAVTNATFTFSATETATFEVRLDGGTFAPATSPHVLNGIVDGSHTLDVRARDGAGNTDATPASTTWTVDTTPPDTNITAAPAAGSAVNHATFTASSSEANSTLEASVDGAAFTTVTSPYAINSAADGEHTIQFRARDAAGNVDATPASATWLHDGTPPQVNLQFPSRNFYTDAATVSVRGAATDPHGVTALSINGVAAQTLDGYSHWSAVIPVPVGTNPLTISSTDGPGNSASVNAATMANRGPFVNSARGVAFDASRNRVLVIDTATSDIVAFRRNDGIGQMLSQGPVPGTTPGFALEEMVIDAVNDRAIVLNATDGTMLAVNLATGVRSVLSPDTGPASPTRIVGAICFAFDAASQRAYVTVGLTASVVRIDLATGTRNVVASNLVGSGDALVNPYGIVFDKVTNPASPRLLTIISPFGNPGIVAIDLSTGNRTPFSGTSTGTGVALNAPLGMVMDAAGQRVLVSDVNLGSIVGVSLANGNRTVISSGLTDGTGPYVAFGLGLTFDPATRTVIGAHLGGFAELDSVTAVRRAFPFSSIGFSDHIGSPTSLVIERTNGTPTSLLWVQLGQGMFYRLDLQSSNRAVFSWAGHFGSGPSLDGAVDMLLDSRPAANSRAALVLIGAPAPKLVSVDLVTGDRTLVGDIHVGSIDNAPVKMALDVANNRVLFSNNESLNTEIDELYAMNLANGGVTLVSGPSNAGPTFTVPGSMVLEPVTSPTRLLVSDLYQPRILAIDLATGDRSLFDDGTSNAGVQFTRVGPMVVDTAQSRLLAAHVNYPSFVYSQPIAGGMRDLVTGANPATFAVRGGGPPLFYTTGMDVDFAAQIAYAASSNNGSIFAIDLVSGDRVVMAR